MTVSRSWSASARAKGWPAPGARRRAGRAAGVVGGGQGGGQFGGEVVEDGGGEPREVAEDGGVLAELFEPCDHGCLVPTPAGVRQPS